MITGITQGQLWASKSGKGPQIRISGIDTDAQEVYYAYDGDTDHPGGSTPVATFLKSYRLVRS